MFARTRARTTVALTSHSDAMRRAALAANELEATFTQMLPDWTGSHVRMFRFFGGGAAADRARQSQERS